MRQLNHLKAFDIDFNWGPGGINAFAPPGLWADADPARHIEWYQSIGANVVQTFCVSCNGYAWYQGGVVPEQPGLASDFLPEMVRLGHAADMQVMGYFCIGSNTRWGLENPDLSYGATSQPHIPFTDTYLAYLSETIRDALKRTGMDGFMIDWIWNPIRVERPTRWWEYDMEWVHDTRDWIDAEKALYEQLMGERFPDSGLLSTAKEIEYGRRALARCWKVIREARDAVNPDAVIWLSCNNVDHPHLEGSALFHEVDWFMNEHPDAHVLESLEARIGPNSGIMQCLCGWGDKHDASTLMPHLAAKGIGLYGFARPDASSFPPIHSEDPALAGNAANIETIAHFYRQQN